MPVLIFLFTFITFHISASTLLEGLELIQTGKMIEGYGRLEDAFLAESDTFQKGKLAHLLTFAPADAVKTTPVYYARYALKYHSQLKKAEVLKLKLHIGDSFMEFGEFKMALAMYQDVAKSSPEAQDYINYQLGYYHLNTGTREKAFSYWSELVQSNSEYSSHALKSIGRYWEKLGFPGEIDSLSSKTSFMEGFIVSIDEREKQFTLKDINLFVFKRSSPQMLTALIEKNPLFMKNPCDFVNWYDSKYELPNTLVFPYLQRCMVGKNDFLVKILQIAQKQAVNIDETSFLASLYQRLGMNKEGCALAIKKEILSMALTMCEEKSKEILSAIRIVLNKKQNEHYSYLRGSRVIKSSLALTPPEQQLLMIVVSEEAYIQEFIGDKEAFGRLMKDLIISDDGLLKFVLFNGRTPENSQFVSRYLHGEDAKSLLAYLSSDSQFVGSVCGLNGKTLKKIALESKIRFQNLTREEISCTEGLIDGDKGLALLIVEKIIQNATRVNLKVNVTLAEELLKNDTVKSLPLIDQISMLSTGLGQDISSYLKVQEHHVKSSRSSEELLSEVKKLKKLRSVIQGHRWMSKMIAEKSSAFFNSLLETFLKKNQQVLKSLSLQNQFKSFTEELRFP